MHYPSGGDTFTVIGAEDAGDAVLGETDPAFQNNVVLLVKEMPVRRNDEWFLARRVHPSSEGVLNNRHRDAFPDRPGIIAKRIAHSQAKKEVSGGKWRFRK